VLLIFGICTLLGISSLVIKNSSPKIGFAALAATVTGMLLFLLRLLSVRKNIIWMKNAKKDNIKQPAGN
jgi:multisubunit Na+/H+ antiporter MnhB subunit